MSVMMMMMMMNSFYPFEGAAIATKYLTSRAELQLINQEEKVKKYDTEYLERKSILYPCDV